MAEAVVKPMMDTMNTALRPKRLASQLVVGVMIAAAMM